MVLKQVIIIRQDLKLPKGKMSVQTAHASVEAVLRSDKEKVREWRQSGLAKIVLKANQTGRKIVKPGIRAGEIDYKVRSVIESHGYGRYFTHRTGHGLGLDIHEPPFIRSDNQKIIRQGMTFTIEPGIYIPDKGGVRIEDDIYVSQTESESLTNLARELWVIED